VILVDANILIYAIDQDSPPPCPGATLLEEALSGDLGWPALDRDSILAFIRGSRLSLGHRAEPAFP
jgi:predicted nucleic acid-binding protein